MDTFGEFKNIGDINVTVFKSNDNHYSFYLKSSNEDLSSVVDILEDTLKLY